MPSDVDDPMIANPVSRWLILAVHIDAFMAAPKAYLTAWWWRIRRKRLRARSQLAPLLGRSRRAYRLWLTQQDNIVHEQSAEALPGPPIIALIYGGSDQGALAETLDSLSVQDVLPLVIGTSDGSMLVDAVGDIDWNSNGWFMPIVAGDRLAPDAIQVYRTAIARGDAHVIYADDDELDEMGHRRAPHFKPDWNAELYRHFDYLSGACVVRADRDVFDRLRAATDWLGQIVTLAMGDTPPLHVRQILHHRRARPKARLPLPAVPVGETVELPSVTVIVPTRNQAKLLANCLSGLAMTDYPSIDVIVVDNDSEDPETLEYLAGLDPARHRVVRHPGAFNFSTINNRAAQAAQGDLLCLLNNDIEILDPDWLKIMAIQALREEVGAVGAQLLYPDGRIQHAGVVLGVGGGAAHAHRLLRPGDHGYFGRHMLPQFVSAVTAACLVVKRERFLAVGGFDERNFAVAFNDVDLCMRLNDRGWQSIYEPRASLIHHESVSRGFDRDIAGSTRLAGELAALKRLWGTASGVDPFHHPQLSPSSEQFVIRL